MTTVAGTLPPGNAASMRSSVLRIGVPLRDMPVGAGVLELHVQRGHREGDEQAAGDEHRGDRVLEDAVRIAFHMRDSPLVLWRRLAT